MDLLGYKSHRQTYIDLAYLTSKERNNQIAELNEFDNEYNTRVIYDITDGLMNNYWTSQSINGFNTVCLELVFSDNKLVYEENSYEM